MSRAEIKDKENIKMDFFLKESYKIRLFEEMLIDQYSKGKIKGTLHTSIGQETIPVVIYQYLTEDDWIFSNHRGHGHFLARTNDYLGLACEILGKKNGVSGGVGEVSIYMRKIIFQMVFKVV